MSTGFVIALGTAALWALYLVVSRHVVGGAGFDPWAYTLVQVLIGGLVLLWLGRHAPADWRGLLTPWMIGYGILRVWITGMSSAALVYLVATQSTLLSTMNVLLGAAAAWFVHRIAPPKGERLALVLLAIGLATLAIFLSPSAAYAGALWLLCSESGVVIGAMAVERHPRNRSEDIAKRSRFAGDTLIVTSLVLILAWSAAGLIGLTCSPWDIGAKAFGNPMLWAWGIGVGLVFRGPGQWATFYALRVAGTQGYLIALTLMPLFTIAFEFAGAGLGWTNAPAMSWGEWIGAAIIGAASIWLMTARLRPGR